MDPDCAEAYDVIAEILYDDGIIDHANQFYGSAARLRASTKRWNPTAQRPTMSSHRFSTMMAALITRISSMGVLHFCLFGGAFAWSVACVCACVWLRVCSCLCFVDCLRSCILYDSWLALAGCVVACVVACLCACLFARLLTIMRDNQATTHVHRWSLGSRGLAF